MRSSRVKAAGREWPFQYRPLTRGELKGVSALEDEWERAKYVIAAAVVGLPEDLDELPFGVGISVAKRVLGISTPDLEELVAAARERVVESATVQEMLIATAWPEYTFEVQDGLTIEAWVDLWARAEWKLIAILGVNPEDLQQMLLPPEERVRQESQSSMSRIEQMAAVAGPEVEEAQEQLGQAAAKAIERLRQKGLLTD
jgi:hypothetical protein